LIADNCFQLHRVFLFALHFLPTAIMIALRRVKTLHPPRVIGWVIYVRPGFQAITGFSTFSISKSRVPDSYPAVFDRVKFVDTFISLQSLEVVQPRNLAKFETVELENAELGSWD
jgi:hypothetical protein